jgi:outer membrane protein
MHNILNISNISTIQFFLKFNSTMKKLVFIIILVLAGFSAACAQTAMGSDSLQLDSTIARVLRTHPSVKEAEEALNAADARIALAKSANLPYVDASAQYSRIDPVSKVSLMGQTFSFYPENNYNLTVNYSQVIWDFGKTKDAIDAENANKTVAQQSIETVRQKLAMSTINAYYILVYLDEAIDIKNEELKNLKDHLSFVEKKEQTGSATRYEILTTQVKISAIESQKTDLLSGRKVQETVLNSLLGQPTETALLPSKSVKLFDNQISQDSLISHALQHRNELIVAQKQLDASTMQVKLAEAANNPKLSIFASAGEKNGYTPDLNQIKANFVAGLSLNVPLFDGFRKKNNIILAKSHISTTQYQMENTRRNISNEVVSASTISQYNNKKINQFSMQVKQATEALELAKVNFEAGTITNLDLLDAETNLSESKLMLLKSQIDYSVSLSALKQALGDLLY